MNGSQTLHTNNKREHEMKYKSIKYFGIIAIPIIAHTLSIIGLLILAMVAIYVLSLISPVILILFGVIVDIMTSVIIMDDIDYIRTYFSMIKHNKDTV